MVIFHSAIKLAIDFSENDYLQRTDKFNKPFDIHPLT